MFRGINMTQLTFDVHENRLVGPIHSAKVVTTNFKAEFIIHYNMFTRDSFEVSMVKDGSRRSLGNYVACLEQAKKLCEIELKKTQDD